MYLVIYRLLTATIKVPSPGQAVSENVHELLPDMKFKIGTTYTAIGWVPIQKEIYYK